MSFDLSLAIKSELVIGQRFLSIAEPELGLGVVSAVDQAQKTLKVFFKSQQKERMYALKSAPIQRKIFKVEDKVSIDPELFKKDSAQLLPSVIDACDKISREHVFTVKDIFLREHLIYYKIDFQNLEIDLCETAILDKIYHSSPLDKLLIQGPDEMKVGQLRRLASAVKNKMGESRSLGLLGAKLSLIPHQYYIASKVLDSSEPRVLLSDEVGLGKTIEAGLIIHKMLRTERAQKILILVPDSLVYQWFIEMYKKFQINFTTLNQETHLEPGTNPFDDHQRVIVNIGLLKGSDMAFKMALDVAWDLVLIDEAHQLKWSPEKVSPEYKIAEALSHRSKGLILLTATPLIKGMEGHFARLRLIDPARFYDFESYLNEVRDYKKQAQLALELLASNSREDLEKLKEMQESHGTGRVMYRNTREKMAAYFPFFPARKLTAIALENNSRSMIGIEDDETIGRTFDIKLDWLYSFLEQHRNDKILLLAKSRTVILCLEKLIKENMPSLKVASFHSGMSFIERDQKAQLFRDPDGASLMLCTEVGSEGRNFEVASKLVIFDLPKTPDQLEQRIGRLDRIGQTKDISIFQPYVKNTFEELLFRFYHQVFNAYEVSAKGASIIFQEKEHLLKEFLLTPEKAFEKSSQDKIVFDQFVLQSQKHYGELLQELEKGRDVLVELNSFHRDDALGLIDEIRKLDEDPMLKKFMDQVFECFGVECIEISPDVFHVFPSENMILPHFPGLADADGITMTYSRKKAILNEDYVFLSFDHPMVIEVLDLILDQQMGTSTALMRKIQKENAKTFIQCFFKLKLNGTINYNTRLIIDSLEERVLIDSACANHSEKVSVQDIEERTQSLTPEFGQKLKTLPKNAILKVIQEAQKMAEKPLQDKLSRIEQRLIKYYDFEIQRLKEMSLKNKNIRPSEIQTLLDQKEQSLQSLKNSEIILDSISLIF